VGQRKGKTFDKAIGDMAGFRAETLSKSKKLSKGTIICYLLSDAAQIELANR
jgi:ketol-acid reductoisomerase